MSVSSSSMRLWQLISPALPVGAYAYSGGLEYAVDCDWVNDESSAEDWILGQIKNNLSRLDVPVFYRLYDAWKNQQTDQIIYWNEMILALRESSELRMEDANLGDALTRVLSGLDISLPDLNTDEKAFVTIFSFACQQWNIDKLEAAQGLLWSWCENQVAAAIKIIPLGQTSGQKIMSAAIEPVAEACEKAMHYEDDDIGLLAPALAIASALHETQYSRLFRS